eukprot:m.278058 g.278058  ORF g.278058 m.278058 type:complete len:945 (+) comp16314_c0_seq41:207-3041(+)
MNMFSRVPHSVYNLWPPLAYQRSNRFAWTRSPVFTAGSRGMQSFQIQNTKAAVGFDFGTESVRACLLSEHGDILGEGASSYKHGQITARHIEVLDTLNINLPSGSAIQHPNDWLASATEALSIAVKEVKGVNIVGIGVDFTSCTMVPVDIHGQPLCMQDHFRHRLHAWPKLWKHHGAHTQAAELTDRALERRERFLNRYGNVIGTEWCFPKALEVYDEDAEIFNEMALWVEAGDWFVWQLTGGQFPARSTCQAGYKACWSKEEGYPSAEFLNSVRPGFGDSVLKRMQGPMVAPGHACGVLQSSDKLPAELKEMGEILSTKNTNQTPIAVSAAVIDAHAGVPGVNVAAPSEMVMVLGTSACYLVNSTSFKQIDGFAGAVFDGIIPGLVGYEAGQSAAGDLFSWLQDFSGQSLAQLEKKALEIPAGSHGVLVVDHFNGCRTPLMDQSLRGEILGLGLDTDPASVYRAIAEGISMGCKRIVDLVMSQGVDVTKLVATGGLSQTALLPQVLADVLQKDILIHPAQNGPAMGAAIYGACASTLFNHDMVKCVESMAHKVPNDPRYRVKPRMEVKEVYSSLYRRYMSHARPTRDEQDRLGLPQRRNLSTKVEEAVFIHGKRDVRVHEFHNSNEETFDSIKLSIEAVGICGSDLHYYKDGGIGSDAITSPFVPGHELAARVQKSSGNGLNKGDLVGIDPQMPCSHCEWCRKGESHLCPSMKFMGAPPYPGGMRTGTVGMPRSSVHPLKSWTINQAVMLEPLCVALHATDLIQKKNGTALVLGLGPIGLLIVELLSLESTIKNIIAVDPIPYRAEAGSKAGATHVSTSLADVHKLTNGQGCDLVWEATNSPDGMLYACTATKIGGHICLVGIPDGNMYTPIPADLIRRRALTLKTSRRYGAVFNRAIQLVTENSIDVEWIVTHEFPLSDAAYAFEFVAGYREECLKAILKTG